MKIDSSKDPTVSVSVEESVVVLSLPVFGLLDLASSTIPKFCIVVSAFVWLKFSSFSKLVEDFESERQGKG